jgi:hypothetical protein
MSSSGSGLAYGRVASDSVGPGLLTAAKLASMRLAGAAPGTPTLRGLLFCGICDRRMQGHWANAAPYAAVSPASTPSLTMPATR